MSALPARLAELFCSFSKSETFRSERIKFLASGRSAGKTVTFAGQQHTVEELTPEAFAGVDLAIGSTPDEVARDFAPWAVERGCVVVDESGYWRMEPDVPLVIPEVNPEAALEHHGIIASPNCSTTQMVVALKPLHDAARVRRVVVSTYQATSGAGLAGCRRIWSTALAPSSPASRIRNETFAHDIAFNLIPQIGSPKHEGYTSEEMKMVYETRKILGDDSIQVCPTCVRVPVSNCHSESILVETERKLTVDEARELFAATPGIVVVDDLDRASVSDADELRRPRRSVHRPHSRRPFQPQRLGVLVRQRQSPQRRRHQRRANRRVAGAQPGGRPRNLRDRFAGLVGRHAHAQVDPGLRRHRVSRLADSAQPPHRSANAHRRAEQDHRRADRRSRQRPNRCRRACARPGGQLRHEQRARTPNILQRALNAELPDDIAALAVEEAPPGFHARRHADAQALSLRDPRRPAGDVFRRHYVWQVYRRLDDAAMQRAAEPLIGQHDFAAFESRGSKRSSSVRTFSS